MTDSVIVRAPLEISRVESSGVDADTVALRLAGRWLDLTAVDEQELLVVQVDGRRHRFPGEREPGPGDSESWSVTFTMPVWAEPRRQGQAALWIGNAVIPVSPAAPRAPAAGGDAAAKRAKAAAKEAKAAARRATAAAAGMPAAAQRAAAPAPDRHGLPAGASAGREPWRDGPLSDLLLKETVTALQAELEHGSAEAARMRAALAGAQAELQARDARQAALEATQAELRAELERVTAAVQRRRAQPDAQVVAAERARAEAGRQLAEAGRWSEELAAMTVARDVAVSDSTALRAELERLGTELAATRERIAAEDGDLGAAHRLLADARALSDELRSP